MKDELLDHYDDVKDQAKQRLQDFQAVPTTTRAWFSELAFCVFAANSSADMAAKAQRLLDPVLEEGSADAYREAVKGKVRFYNARSSYLAHNYDVVQGLDDFPEAVHDADDKRRFLIDSFKGIGVKEASHFLRNTGHNGYCILDKHVRRVCEALGVHSDADYPSHLDEYRRREQAIHRFCDDHGLDVDVFDLAVWSYNTGEIQK